MSFTEEFLTLCKKHGLSRKNAVNIVSHVDSKKEIRKINKRIRSLKNSIANADREIEVLMKRRDEMKDENWKRNITNMIVSLAITRDYFRNEHLKLKKTITNLQETE